MAPKAARKFWEKAFLANFAPNDSAILQLYLKRRSKFVSYGSRYFGYWLRYGSSYVVYQCSRNQTSFLTKATSYSSTFGPLITTIRWFYDNLEFEVIKDQIEKPDGTIENRSIEMGKTKFEHFIEMERLWLQHEIQNYEKLPKIIKFGSFSLVKN